MRAETKLRPSSPSRNQNENHGLRTERQIELYRKREAARREQAERREVEARVRHSNFELAQRIIVLVLVVGIIGLTVAICLATKPELLPLALPAGGLVGLLGVLVHRRGGSAG